MNLLATPLEQTSGNQWSQATVRAIGGDATALPDNSEKSSQKPIWDAVAGNGSDKKLEGNEMALITKEYIMADAASVGAFLRDHSAIAPILVGALPHLRSTFGIDASFALKTSTDETGWRDLYAVIMWPGDPQDAWVRLEKFEDAWWIAISSLAAGRLNFTYELV